MRKTTVLIIFFAFLVTSLQLNAQITYPVNDVANPREGCYAFINATIIKDAQTTLQNASMIIRKGKIMRCYFVANQESSFYKSTVFSKIMEYVQQHRTGIYLRETEKFLVLTFEKVRTMKEADERLSEVSEFVGK